MFLKKERRKLILESAIYIVTCAQGRQKREGVRWFRRTRANRFFFGVFFLFWGVGGAFTPGAKSGCDGPACATKQLRRHVAATTSRNKECGQEADKSGQSRASC